MSLPHSSRKVVLGLGSSLGRSEVYLRQAIHELSFFVLKNPKFSSIYSSPALLPSGAPKSWDKPYLNMAVSGETHLEPLGLLHEIKKIEKKLGRKERTRWAPREIDIDILAYEGFSGNIEDVANKEVFLLTLPHPGLSLRAFAYVPFREVEPHWARELSLPIETHSLSRVGSFRFSELMGIVNITPDSFSDGGGKNFENAAKYARELFCDGAGIIDLGAESTRPGAQALSSRKEWERLNPVLSELRKTVSRNEGYRISVDTYHPETAVCAIEFGADTINDVSGFQNEKMMELAARSQVELVMMHSLSVPANREIVLREDSDPVFEVFTWGEKQIQKFVSSGIRKDRIVFDPGIGFGKTAEQSLKILENIEKFHALGVKLLVGHSRKSFFSKINSTKKPHERDPETGVVSTELVRKHIHYLRVHNIKAHILAL